MTKFEIITVVCATITSFLAVYTVYRDYFRDISKKISKKLLIKRIDYLVEYGLHDDQSKGLTIFTIDIKNDSSSVVTFSTVSALFTNKQQTKYIDVVGFKSVLNPGETKTTIL